MTLPARAALSRRRFIAISAAAIAGPAAAAATGAAPAPLHQWRGQALGARATITLAHPDGARLAALALAEIARLEAVFSLHQPGSALRRLNDTGRIAAPPFDLLACLDLCGRVHRATGGKFDPTVQPLWHLYARSHAEGRPPAAAEIAAAQARTGWARVQYDAAAVILPPGMALTLNGVAQGFIADRVAALLAAEGLTDVLVDTGELRALGGHPEGGGWPVRLRAGDRLLPDPVPLRDRALATSAPLGTAFDAAGRVGHILDPQTGRPAAPRWSLVSVTAGSAGVADALTTAFCLMDHPAIEAALPAFPGAALTALIPG